MNNSHRRTFIDSCILLDLFTNDPVWKAWSIQKLTAAGKNGDLIINQIVFSEISIGFSRIEKIVTILKNMGIVIEPIPEEAAFLAGKAYKAYRERGGEKTAPLPDFFIGAHAAVRSIPLITRDPKRMRQCYPRLELVTPDSP